MLASLWRRKLLVGAIVATAVALGIIALLVIARVVHTPRRTSAEDLSLRTRLKDAKDEDTKNGPSISLDLSRVIETQSRLLTVSGSGAPGRAATRA